MASEDKISEALQARSMNVQLSAGQLDRIKQDAVLPRISWRVPQRLLAVALSLLLLWFVIDAAHDKRASVVLPEPSSSIGLSDIQASLHPNASGVTLSVEPWSAMDADTTVALSTNEFPAFRVSILGTPANDGILRVWGLGQDRSTPPLHEQLFEARSGVSIVRLTRALDPGWFQAEAVISVDGFPHTMASRAFFVSAHEGLVRVGDLTIRDEFILGHITLELGRVQMTPNGTRIRLAGTTPHFPLLSLAVNTPWELFLLADGVELSKAYPKRLPSSDPRHVVIDPWYNNVFAPIPAETKTLVVKIVEHVATEGGHEVREAVTLTIAIDEKRLEGLKAPSPTTLNEYDTPVRRHDALLYLAFLSLGAYPIYAGYLKWGRKMH